MASPRAGGSGPACQDVAELAPGGCADAARPRVHGVHRAEISVEDPRATDVRELLERHLEFARSHTPPEGVFALDADDLADPAVTFFSYRLDGALLAVGALKQLDRRHGELKS